MTDLDASFLPVAVVAALGLAAWQYLTSRAVLILERRLARVETLTAERRGPRAACPLANQHGLLPPRAQCPECGIYGSLRPGVKS